MTNEIQNSGFYGQLMVTAENDPYGFWNKDGVRIEVMAAVV